MKPRSLFTSVSWPRGRQPRRAVLLERVDAILPWHDLERLVDPLYPKPTTGRPPYPLRVMVRLYALAWMFRLSEESAEDLILDSHSAALFVGLDPWRPRPPGASAIRNFRHLVAKVPDDGFHLALSLALAVARAELRPGKIVEPVLKTRPGGVTVNGDTL